MGARRLALLLGSVLLGISAPVLAQAPGGDSGEIEMEGDQPAPDEPTEQEPTEPAPVVKDPKVAKTWLKAAAQLVKKGDQLAKKNDAAGAKTQYDNAITAYQKAIEASEEAAAVPITYELALAEDKAGSTVDALAHLKVVAAAQGQKPDLMKKAQAKLDELSMKVGIVTLSIEPAGTQISIDGNAVGEAPLATPLTLMPGTHTVSMTAVGYQPKDVELKVEAGSESERKIALEAVPIVTKPPVLEPEPEKPKAEAPSMMPVYIGGGATAAFAIGAAVTGILAVGKHNTFTSPDSTSPERKDAQVQGKNLALVSDICLGGAVVAGAFTAYWYLFKWKPAHRAYEDRDKPAAAPVAPDVDAALVPKINVVPWVQPDAGGLVVAGSF
ncbi:MAG: PEGA domain-containing protein [Kofleriaceae bacterium]|nr:PEGA domain-containing protein [Kofleriaceae bacterium]